MVVFTCTVFVINYFVICVCVNVSGGVVCVSFSVCVLVICTLAQFG